MFTTHLGKKNPQYFLIKHCQLSEIKTALMQSCLAQERAKIKGKDESEDGKNFPLPLK